jgi:hypothetical protein
MATYQLRISSEQGDVLDEYVFEASDLRTATAGARLAHAQEMASGGMSELFEVELKLVSAWGRGNA